MTESPTGDKATPILDPPPGSIGCIGSLREHIQAAKGSMAGLIAPTIEPEPDMMDHGDVEMLFRCLMQFARHLAKKYGFTIRQWPPS